MPWLFKSFHSYLGCHGQSMGTGWRWPFFPNQLRLASRFPLPRRNGMGASSGQLQQLQSLRFDLLFDHLFVSLLKMRMVFTDDLTGSVQNCCQIIAMFVYSSFYVEWIHWGILSGCPLPGFMWTRCKSWISSIFAHPKIDGLSLLPLLLPLLHVTLQKSAGIDATPEGFSRFQCWWSLEYAGPIDQIQLIWGRPLRDGIVPRRGELVFPI